jgi:hypothetical protein
MRQNLRQEPYEVIPHVRICAGGVGQPTFLPRPDLKTLKINVMFYYRQD